MLCFDQLFSLSKKDFFFMYSHKTFTDLFFFVKTCKTDTTYKTCKHLTWSTLFQFIKNVQEFIQFRLNLKLQYFFITDKWKKRYGNVEYTPHVTTDAVKIVKIFLIFSCKSLKFPTICIQNLVIRLNHPEKLRYKVKVLIFKKNDWKKTSGRVNISRVRYKKYSGYNLNQCSFY